MTMPTCGNDHAHCNQVYKYDVEQKFDEAQEMNAKRQREPSLKASWLIYIYIFLAM